MDEPADPLWRCGRHEKREEIMWLERIGERTALCMAIIAVVVLVWGLR